MAVLPAPNHLTGAIEVVTVRGRRITHYRPVNITYESASGEHLHVEVVDQMPDDEGTATYNYKAVRSVRFINDRDQT